jgi:hypothetical protein
MFISLTCAHQTDLASRGNIVLNGFVEIEAERSGWVAFVSQAEVAPRVREGQVLKA